MVRLERAKIGGEPLTSDVLKFSCCVFDFILQAHAGFVRNLPSCTPLFLIGYLHILGDLSSSHCNVWRHGEKCTQPASTLLWIFPKYFHNSVNIAHKASLSYSSGFFPKSHGIHLGISCTFPLNQCFRFQ